jgi:hypothetical protein
MIENKLTRFFNIKENKNFNKHTLVGNSYQLYEPNITLTKPNTSYNIMHMDTKTSIRNINDIVYSLNNYKYRCDDFNKEKAKDNYLFSGCSYTFGIGLPYQSMWSVKLNTYLGGESFFNLGIYGGSYEQIINDVYDYIRIFDKPKAIFLLLPNLERIPTFQKIEDDYYLRNLHLVPKSHPEYRKLFKIYEPQILVYRFYKLLQQLEDYCKIQDIPLLWSTWDLQLDKVITNCLEFNNFFSIFSDEKISMLLEIEKIKGSEIEDPIESKYFNEARDCHPSGRMNVFYQKCFSTEWEKYCEKNNIKD